MQEEKKIKLRIVKLTDTKYMVQKFRKGITPTSYGVPVPGWCNDLDEPVDYDTALAYVAMYKPEDKKEVVYEVEY